MQVISENIFDTFSPDVLTEQEMNNILGGKRRKPKSRDKDIFDTDDELE